MARNFGVERKPMIITESEYRFIRNLSIGLLVAAIVLASVPVLMVLS